MLHNVKHLILGFLFGVFISSLVWYVVFQPRNEVDYISVSPISATPSIDPPIKSTSNLEKEGKININQATVEDLIKLPGIGESKALSIISFRERYGKFQELNELLYINGIGENLLESIEPFIYISDED